VRTRYLISPGIRTRLTRLMWRLDTRVGLLTMFAVALAIRLAIAPWAGFYSDLNSFRIWSVALAHVGPHRFYSSVPFADYPPGYLYILWVIGKISATPGYLLLKLPTLLADLGVAWVAGTLAARIAPPSLARRVPLRPLIAAAVLFNPAILFESAVFGQVNAVPAFFVLSTVLLLLTGRPSLKRDAVAFVLFGFAFATKPQACLALPVLLYVLYRRYLHGRPRPELVDGALNVGLIGMSALVVWIGSALPFGLDPVKLYRFYGKSADVHPWTSSNAYNLWGLLGPWRNDLRGDRVFTVLGIPALYVGLLLFAAAVVFVLVRTHRALERGASSPPTLVFAAALTSLLGYVFLTRMHEHYVFPSIVLLAPLAFKRPIRRAYAALSAFLLLGIWFSFVGYNIQAHVQALRVEPLFGWLYGDFTFFTWQTRTYSFLITALALVLAWRGPDYFLAERPQRESAAEPPERELPPRPAASWMSRLERLSFIGLSERTEDAASSTTWPARLLPAGLVGLAAAFGLIVLRGETRAVQNLNDSSFHLQMVRWASGQIHRGRVPLDGWFPYFSMGSSFFHHYQSLAENLTAYVSHLIGAGNQTTYDWFLYLLLALWPIPVYVGARLLEWGRWPAAAAAAVAPLIVSTPGYGYEHGSYTWQGYGVYSQLWAMWVMPLAWGLTWQAVARGRYYAGAALALAVTIALHFMTGYVAVLTLGVWVILLGGGYVRRAGRAALVVGGSALIAAWVLVPLLGDTKWTTQPVYYRGTFINDGYGARKTLGWLFSGNLLDHGRFPILTILFFTGLVACLLRARADLRARALLGAFALNLLLTFGRRTFGSLIDVFPGFRDAELNRFIMGLDLASILIAGIGLAWLLLATYLGARWLATGRVTLGRYAVAGAVMLALAVGVLEPAWAERARYDNHGSAEIRSQQDYEATDGRDLDKLIAIVQKRHDGRVYSGLFHSDFGQQYRIGSVPVYAWLADRGVDAIGFTFRTIASLSTDPEAAFDETSPAQYQMFNVRYLILPSDHQPPVHARLVASSGRHRLWEVPTSGYFQVVDRSAAISENRTNIEQQTRDFRQSDFASRAIYPGIAFAGGAAPPATFSGATPPPGAPGNVLTQTNDLAGGVFAATVIMTRPAVVLLKASYDPRWSVTVDGLPAKAVMMAPSLVGVEVPVGRHAIRFRYEPYGHYALLLTIGLLTLIGLVLFPRRSRVARRLATLRRGGGFPRPGWAGGRISRTAAAQSGARQSVRRPLSAGRESVVQAGPRWRREVSTPPDPDKDPNEAAP
jgi:Gpi18-like mannosyltransferase